MKKALWLTAFLLLAVWDNAAHAETYTYEFKEKVFTKNETQKLGDVEWTLQTDADYFGSNKDKGIQIGKGSKPAKTITLSTDGISGNIKLIKIETSGAKDIDAKLTVTVDGKPFGKEIKLTNQNKEYEFTGNGKGKIVLNYSQTSQKAIYIKKITVVYDKNNGGEEQGGEQGGEQGEDENEDDEEEDPMANAPTFVFNTENGLTALGISIPGSDKGTSIENDLKSKGITLSNTKGSTNTRVYNSKGKYTLRIYKGGTMTLTSDNGVPITQIEIKIENDGTMTATDGTSISKSNDKWTGNAQSVKFNITKNAFISTINVTTNGTAPKPLQEVKGLKALKDVEDDTEVHLYIADGDQARVLFADEEGNAYVRDKDVKVFFKEVKTNPALKFNQHLAGYIYGKKTSMGGVTVFETTKKTNSEEFIIAEPVQETDITPLTINAEDYKNHLADWVIIKEITVNDGKTTIAGTTIGINNTHKLGESMFYHMPYDKSVVDISAIIFPTDGNSNELRPIYNKVEKTNIHNVAEQEFRPVTYVIDENKDFVLPANNIANASVRLKRKISSEYWNTITLPFGVKNVKGMLRRYKTVEGNTMIFEETNDIEAGVPYLYKPDSNIENPTYKDVTLTNIQAKNIEHGNFLFVGTYKPYDMKTDKTERFLGNNDKLYWPTGNDTNKIPGMRAYFVVPATINDAKVSTDNITSAIDAAHGDTGENLDNAKVYNLGGQFVGVGIEQLPKGIYIVNGKKMVIN